MLRAVKHIKLALIALPLIVVAVLIGFVLAFNMNVFHDQIQSEVERALGPGAKVELGSMSLAYRWPPFVRVGPSAFDSPLARVRWNQLEVELIKVTAPYSVALNFNKLVLALKTPPTEPVAKSPGQAQSASPAQSPPPLSVRLIVVDGEVESDFGALTQLQLKFEQKLLLKSPANLDLRATVRAKICPSGFPCKFLANQMTLSEESVKTSDLKVKLGGLDADVEGASLPKEGRHRWLISLLAKDLSQLPEPPQLSLPATKWRGEVQLKAEVSKESSQTAWASEGSFVARGVGAEIDFKSNEAQVQGPINFDAEGKFSYLNERASLPNLKANVDLSAASIVYSDLLKKDKGVVMKAAVLVGGETQHLKINEFAFDLWNFAGRVTGQVDLKSPYLAQLNLNLKPANLAGSERLFPR